MSNQAQVLEARLIADWIYRAALKLERGEDKDEFTEAIGQIYKDLAQDIRSGKHRNPLSKAKIKGKP